MRRSEINALIGKSLAFAESKGFLLPPFARWTPREWSRKGSAADEIRDCMLGWDLTDFGMGRFRRLGLVLFTIRNGRLRDRRYIKTYCEKMLISEVDQVCPMHYHWNKAEDIINRGGGVLAVQLYNSVRGNRLARSAVEVSVDGVTRKVKAGGIVRLEPGESIFLPSLLFHRFWAEKGKTLIGEVSKVNDDTSDNCFYDKLGRFPKIEEDEAPRYLLFSEYPPAR